MADVDLLEGVLAKTGDLVGGAGESQWERPTPCPQYDVRALISHIVGWAQVFAASASGEEPPGDPASYTAGSWAAADFRTAASRMVDGWRELGFDRKVRMTGGELPAEMVFNMTLMEYLTHGWDLAVATGQPVPYTSDEAEQTLVRAQATLRDEYRGDAFGPKVEVGEDADAVSRLVAFLGREPRPAAGG